MIRRRLLPVITPWLLKGNEHIVNAAYCSTLSNDSSHHVKSKEAEGINTNIKKVRRKAKKKISALNDEEMLQFINQIENQDEIDMDKINSNLKQSMMHKSYKNVLYLVNREAARKYASFIINDLSKNTCFVSELNFGFGMLTSELLKAGVPLIHVYAPNKILHSILNTIRDTYPGRLNVEDFNMLEIGKFHYMDKLVGGNRVEEALRGVKSKKWEDETSMQIITGTNSVMFFNNLVKSLLFRNCFMSRGRPVFYIAISPSIWDKFVCNTKDIHMYTYNRVLFRVMFDAELLGTLDRKAFFPPPKQKKFKMQSARERAKLDSAQVYVVKVEPKIDLYSQLSQKDWLIFWYFTSYHMRKRTNRVIPELEKWVPGCGIRLIMKDYTIFTQFGDLSPTQILDLFKEFKSWPEYEKSYFVDSMMDSLHKVESEVSLLELDLKFKE